MTFTLQDSRISKNSRQQNIVQELPKVLLSDELSVSSYPQIKTDHISLIQNNKSLDKNFDTSDPSSTEELKLQKKEIKTEKKVYNDNMSRTFNRNYQNSMKYLE